MTMLDNKVSLKEATSHCVIDPMPGRCVVIRDGFRYSGKLIIPDKAKQQPTTGIIVAVGDPEKADFLGRRIVWGRYSGMPVTFSGRPTYDILSYDEILGFITDNDVKLDMDDKSLNRED